MEPTTVAIGAIIIAAASEIIALYPGLRENSITQLVLKVLRMLFPRRSDTDLK